MRYPIRVFSDLHLGNSACLIKRVEDLKPLLKGAGSVIFNGDTWQELIVDPEEKSKKLRDELEELCESLDADAYFLPGNHDPSSGEEYFYELLEGQIVIFHGDVVYPEVSPWSAYYLEKKDEIDLLIRNELKEDATIQERYELAHKVVQAMKPEKRNLKYHSKLHYYLNIFWPLKRFVALLNVKRSSHKVTLQFCCKYFPKAKIVIYGHFHTPNFRRENDRFLINTGAFMSGFSSFFCEIQSDKVVVFKVNPCLDHGWSASKMESVNISDSSMKKSH